MKIILASKAGFCMGVRRAMDMVTQLPFNEDETIFTDGPIIHNPQVIDALAMRNIKLLDDSTNLTGKKVIIRSHGITPQRRQSLIKSGSSIIDATCPRVARIQGIIKKYSKMGYGVLIFGDANHSEVKGLLGFAGKHGHALQNPKMTSELPKYKKICIVAQSTKNREKYNEFQAAVRSHYKETKIETFDTLCNSTTLRQEEARQLASKVDAMVVVGGKQSANTCTLAAVSAMESKPVFHIETEKEISSKDFSKFSCVALTAGASTPNWMINRVHEKLLSIKGKNESKIRFLSTLLLRFLLNSNLLLSIGTAFLSYSAALLMKIESNWYQHLIAPLYIYSMLILSNFVDFKSLELNQPSKINFFLKYRRLLVTSAIVCASVATLLAASIRFETLFVVTAALLLGILYSLPLLPEKWKQKFHLHQLRDIPASKNILIALAWSAMTVLIHPISMSGHTVLQTHVIVTFFWVFGLIMIRSVIYDIRYLQGDTLMGHGTLPVLLGMKTTRKFLNFLFVAISLLIISATMFGRLSSLGYLMAVPLIYLFVAQKIMLNKDVNIGIMFHPILDIELLLYGFLSILWYHCIS